jgi:hypothetical protein
MSFFRETGCLLNSRLHVTTCAFLMTSRSYGFIGVWRFARRSKQAFYSEDEIVNQNMSHGARRRYHSHREEKDFYSDCIRTGKRIDRSTAIIQEIHQIKPAFINSES